MPLLAAPLHREMRVFRVAADEKTRRHLENLGILPGAKITLLASGSGDMLLKVHDGRLAVDRSLAGKIFVGEAV